MHIHVYVCTIFLNCPTIMDNFETNVRIIIINSYFCLETVFVQKSVTVSVNMENILLLCQKTIILLMIHFPPPILLYTTPPPFSTPHT